MATTTGPLAQTINQECNICFDITQARSCGNSPCSFRSCDNCIVTYNKTHCPHCNQRSATFSDIIRENQPKRDFEVLINNRQFSQTDATEGCCIKTVAQDGVTEYKLCSCNSLVDGLLMTACCCGYVNLTGTILNYFLSGNLTPPTLYGCCNNISALGCTCCAFTSCCCYLLERQCQNTVIVTENRYYRGTLFPYPAYMTMERGSTVPPATVVPLSEDTELP